VKIKKTGDRIFPIHFVAPHATVEQGGHLRVMNRASQISSLLKGILKVIWRAIRNVKNN
jgi:hypothetical protein